MLSEFYYILKYKNGQDEGKQHEMQYTHTHTKRLRQNLITGVEGVNNTLK